MAADTRKQNFWINVSNTDLHKLFTTAMQRLFCKVMTQKWVKPQANIQQLTCDYELSAQTSLKVLA